MEALLQDIRYGARMLLKNPGFAVVAILTLALGIGANTAIFTVVNTVLLHPINVHDPDRIMGIFTGDERNREPLNRFLPVSRLNAQDIAERAKSFSGVAMYEGTGVSMVVNGTPQRFNADLVSANFFDVVGVSAAMGRALRREDDNPGAPPVVVLSYGVWQRSFGSNRGIVGQSVLLNGQGFTVVGVAPRGFQGVVALGGPDMWVPLSTHDLVLAGIIKQMYSERRFLGFFAIGRLKPGVTPEQAGAELKTIGAQLTSEYPIPNQGRSLTVVPLLESTINPNVQGMFVRAGALIMAIVGLVLLIACANISNLLLSRAAARKREISIRLALGASRSRIVVQLLTESILLAAAGGVIGLGVASIARDALWHFRPPFLMDSNMQLTLDGRVLLFALVVSLATGIVFGLAPALQASHPDLVTELKDRTRTELFSGRRFNLRSAFVIAQFALSLVALIGAGLFLVSLRHAQRIDPGFDTNNLGMLSFDLGSLNYDDARSKKFEDRVLEQVRALPGIRSATLATNVPLFGGTAIARTVFPEGVDNSSRRNGVLVQTDIVSAGYLQAMSIPLLRGRSFDSSDREDSPRVAILNEAAVRRFWPNEDPVGKRFKFFGENYIVQVVGVARDAKYNTLGEDPLPYLYMPVIQNPSLAMTLFFRSAGDSRAALSSVRSQVQALDRNLPLTNVWPIGEVISQGLWAAKFSAVLLGIFAAMAVLLAAIGVYGVVAYSVGQRVREIGIRMALGAQRNEILSMILGQSAKTLGIGLALGVITALIAARLITNLLYGVSAAAPLPFILLPLLLTVIGLLATYIPARRAMRVDPMRALREE